MSESPSSPRPIRWWPAVFMLLVGSAGIGIARGKSDWAYQQMGNMVFIASVLFLYVGLLAWWLFFSRASGKARLAVLALAVLPCVLFRHRGMTGDFMPIIETRFGKKPIATTTAAAPASAIPHTDFTQIFGPSRDSRLSGITLDPDWASHPPVLLWRHPVGAAWSGFAVVGERAVTQEQDGTEELVTCYELTTGKQLWRSASAGRYDTKIAGEGPRATPTISEGRVFTYGATGILRCNDLATGGTIWTRDTVKDAGTKVPDFGFASSPLIHEGKVIVSAGGAKSLLAYRTRDGEPVWAAGSRPVSYSSPFLHTLSGRPQILMFNNEAITAHDPATGSVLWEHPWGKGMPHVSAPIAVGENRILFSSGYGVGSALLEIAPDANGKLSASEVWKTVRFQAKFSNPVERDGFVYGVSDGIFACLDLRDGTVKWKNGRYGHGQGLLIGELYLQMQETGEITLLRPTPEAANELAALPIFDSKTWNPIALSGDLLLMRNDREAVCLRLPVKIK